MTLSLHTERKGHLLRFSSSFAQEAIPEARYVNKGVYIGNPLLYT